MPSKSPTSNSFHPEISRPVVGSGVRMLLCLLLSLQPFISHAHQVTYLFSGTVSRVDSAAPDKAPMEGDAFQGVIAFDADKPQIQVDDEDNNWYQYRSSGRVTLRIADRTWTNTAPGDPYCAVDMFMTYPAIRFWCRSNEAGAWARRLVLDFWDLNGAWGSLDPYPLGPFLPETLGAQDITGLLSLFSDDFIARGDMTINDVRIVSEPASTSLMFAVALSMAMAWPRRRGGVSFLSRLRGSFLRGVTRRAVTPVS